MQAEEDPHRLAGIIVAIGFAVLMVSIGLRVLGLGL